jgi:hypothetical protein
VLQVIETTGEILWLGVRDDFRNWLQLGLRPAKENENPELDRMSGWGRRDRD